MFTTYSFATVKSIAASTRYFFERMTSTDTFTIFYWGRHRMIKKILKIFFNQEPKVDHFSGERKKRKIFFDGINNVLREYFAKNYVDIKSDFLLDTDEINTFHKFSITSQNWKITVQIYYDIAGIIFSIPYNPSQVYCSSDGVSVAIRAANRDIDFFLEQGKEKIFEAMDCLFKTYNKGIRDRIDLEA